MTSPSADAPGTRRADEAPGPTGAGNRAKKKFGLVLQGCASLGAYEVGAIDYLYESGMECAIVAGASSGALNAVTLAGGKGHAPKALKELWGMFAADPPVPFVPNLVGQYWSMFGVPHFYTPRMDYWNLPSWTYFTDNTPIRKTLEDLLDWDQVRDSGHMRLFVSASGVENSETAYFHNLYPDKPIGPEYPDMPFEVDHVLASGSFPLGFPWTLVRHRAYWDGGLTDNTPLKPVIDNLRDDEPDTMPIIMIDPFSSTSPQPANLRDVMQRMFEILLRNNLKSDSETAQRYTRFINVLRKAEEELPPHASVRDLDDWKEVMKYVLVKQIRMIDINKPAGENPMDFSHETILRRISAGYDQTRAALEKEPLMP